MSIAMAHLLIVVVVVVLIIGVFAAFVRAIGRRSRSRMEALRNEVARIDQRLLALEHTLNDSHPEQRTWSRDVDYARGLRGAGLARQLPW